MEPPRELAQLLEPGVELLGGVPSSWPPLRFGAPPLLRAPARRARPRRAVAGRRRAGCARAAGAARRRPGRCGSATSAGPRAPARSRRRARRGRRTRRAGPRRLRRQRVGAADRDRTPGRSGDDDRRRHRRAVTDAQHHLRPLALGRAPVVDASRDAGVAGESDRRVLVEQESRAERERVDPVAVVAADDGGGVVPLVAPDRRRVHLEHARALRRHGHEHALRARLRGDERRHAPKRSLLLGEPSDLDELRLRVPVHRRLAALRALHAVGEVDAGRDEIGGASRVARTSLFDHAIRRRPPSFVCQWPTCGLEWPVLQMNASTSRNASPPRAG